MGLPVLSQTYGKQTQVPQFRGLQKLICIEKSGGNKTGRIKTWDCEGVKAGRERQERKESMRVLARHTHAHTGTGNECNGLRDVQKAKV